MIANKLAIVIPYYKPHFFRDTLLSIKNQTDKRFHLYIGNDCSDYDPIKIIKEVFGENYNELLTYRVFDYNLGQIHLTMQWGRCVEMANAPYIWLFSDDDLMPLDAVERFYKFINEHPNADLLRFNINIIDRNDHVIDSDEGHPLHETSLLFLIRRLKRQCLSAACEYIFKHDIYKKAGGFVEFPVGWASDDATWVNFGKTSGIYTIPGNVVLWRSGGHNISTNKDNYTEKIKACLMFIEFVRINYIVSTNLQLFWLWAQFDILNYSFKSKFKLLCSLVYSGMFTFAAVLRFLYYKILKKEFV